MVHWPKQFQSQIGYLFVVFIVPYIIGFELYIIFPFVFLDVSDPLLLTSLLTGIFLTINVYGNMYQFIAKKSSIKGHFLQYDQQQRPRNYRFCSVCESFCPPRSYHCSVCNICILKRDHHCLFTGSCVGYENHRHYIFLIFYFAMAALFATIFNVPYVINLHIVHQTSWPHIVIITFFPVLGFVLSLLPLPQLIIAFTCTLCAASAMLLIVLTIYHMELIVANQTTYERVRLINDYNMGWRYNVMDVFGKRWYWTAVWPFAESPLPGNGLKFPTNTSSNEIRKAR